MPLLTGKNLFRAVQTCEHEAAFWWLGQHSFILKLAKTNLLIDPFLSNVEGRRVPPLFDPSDARDVISLVICTHDHIDHIDPAAVTGLAQLPSITFVAPVACATRMSALGVPDNRLVLMDHADRTEIDGIVIHAVKAAHEQFDRTEDGHYPYLGYVLRGGHRTLYHSGDTVWWEGLQAHLRGWHLDVAMVPINGRDAERYEQNIIGNMTYQEAGDLLGGLAVKLSVPTHYDMFQFNSEDPASFVAYMRSRYPDHPVWVGEPTEPVAF